MSLTLLGVRLEFSALFSVPYLHRVRLILLSSTPRVPIMLVMTHIR
jgi:hypothetical protein